jgi:hypothetical protein
MVGSQSVDSYYNHIRRYGRRTKSHDRHASREGKDQQEGPMGKTHELSKL